jgi:hypothetical protein
VSDDFVSPLVSASRKVATGLIDVLMMLIVLLIAWAIGSFVPLVLETGGKTALQPATVGVLTHCATVGNTAPQPSREGVATQSANLGST